MKGTIERLIERIDSRINKLAEKNMALYDKTEYGDFKKSWQYFENLIRINELEKFKEREMGL